MINRRGVLSAIGLTALGSLSASGAVLVNTADDTLNADLSRLGARAYSEEGIPMFLACINVPAPETSRQLTRAPSALNQLVASAFHRYANEWQRTHPRADAADVAKIVEFLADRDFINGGAEKSL